MVLTFSGIKAKLTTKYKNKLTLSDIKLSFLRFFIPIRDNEIVKKSISTDLNNILKYGQREIGEGTQMGWKAQRGISSPNIYDKKLITPLIKALKKIQADLGW